MDVLALFSFYNVADCIADGNLGYVRLQNSMNSRLGQALVTMRSRHDALVAQRALNYEYVYGCHIQATLEPAD